jgi:probable H4MPT-linked C1 transfer pathway protein
LSSLALDIGGANLKAADGLGYASIRPFALWRQPGRLAEELAQLICASPPCERIAVTMTGELADCFATKADGVRQILAAVTEAAGSRTVAVYQSNGEFTSVCDAASKPVLVAAANWHALASFAGRFVPDAAGLLIDIGSTTTDIIPLADGHAGARGHSDLDRLFTGELVYTGVARSPVCAITSHLPYRAEWYPVAQEMFATTRDAYLMLNELPEDFGDTETADHRPATREGARARLARMFCADTTVYRDADAVEAARAIREKQVEIVAAAVSKVLARFERQLSTVIFSGEGEFLARRAIQHAKVTAPQIALCDKLGPALSRCAPAHALAVLARERFKA